MNGAQLLEELDNEAEEADELGDEAEMAVVEGLWLAEPVGEFSSALGGGSDGIRGGGKPAKPPLPVEQKIASMQPAPLHIGSVQIQKGAGIMVGFPLLSVVDVLPVSTADHVIAGSLLVFIR